MARWRESRDAPTGDASDPSSDESLVTRLTSRDAAALERLYERHAPRVYALCLRMLRARDAAEEILQDTFWQLWAQPERFDPKRGRLPTYLFQIARSRCLDRLRRDRVRATTSLAPSRDLEAVIYDAEGPTPLQSATMAEQRVRVHDALDRLPAECREVLMLSYFEGLTRVEIAEELQIPLGTAKSRARRGLLLLRDLLRSRGVS